MDRVEAAEILRDEMSAYARRPRADLVPLIGETEAYEIKGPREVSYQVEVNVLWDEKPGGSIRVVGGIDDGGFRSSFSPLTDGFLVDADGTVDMPDQDAPASVAARRERTPMTDDQPVDDHPIDTSAEPTRPKGSPRLPPRWFVRTAWVGHRALYRFTGGRKGLWSPKPGKWGTMRLKTTGRKSGQERVAILGFYEDGTDLVTMAMNGWADGEPAWWLNLQAHPDAIVELKDETRAVHGRAAEGEERARLWARWQEFGDDVDGYATRRSTETAVVVLEPRPQD